MKGRATVAFLLSVTLLAHSGRGWADEPRPQQAWLTLAEGWTQLVLHHSEQATAAFDKVLARNKCCIWAHAGRGWVRAQEHQEQRAIRDFSRAIELAPQSPWLRYVRASLYHRQHKEAQALTDCEAALKLAPRVVPVYLLKAGIHCACREYDAALKVCDRALRICPGNPDARLLRGVIYAQKGDLAAALKELSGALERRPCAFAYRLRARIWLCRCDLKAALADLDQAVQREPNDLGARITRSGIYLVYRRYDQAVADCDQAIRINPSCGAAYANRGAAHFKQGERALALADFNRALSLDPRDLESRGNRAQLFGRLGQWDRAIEDSTVLLQRKPNWKKYRQLRLGSYLQTGDLASAEKDVAYLLAQAETTDSGGYRERGDLYLLQARLGVLAGGRAGQEDEDRRRALQDYDRAIRLEPGCALGYCKRAALHLQMEHFPEAIADSSAALRLQPGNKEARILHLQACKARKDTKQALADCTELVQQSRGEERRHWIGERAWLDEEQGKEEEAEADYSEYVQLDPQDPSGWQQRAGFFSRQGENRRAVKDLEQALQRQPGNTPPESRAGLHLQRARLLIRLGDLRGALEDYSVLVQLLPRWSKLHFERALLLALVGDYPLALESGRRGCELMLERGLRSW